MTKPSESDRLMLGNVDYRTHMTDEGDQFQRGLQLAGYRLVGAGYEDGCRDIPELIRRYRPRVMMIHDNRDWDPASVICFRKDIGYTGVERLRTFHGVLKGTVVKDAGPPIEFQRDFVKKIGADFVVIYYHPAAVLKHSYFLKTIPLVRTYHTVDRDVCDQIRMNGQRRQALISGAVSPAYPLRRRIVHHASHIGVEVLRHPGYGNGGSSTPAYLQAIAQYKVHVTTCSAYQFALRKIIESVAMGATPVTDLPDWDVLPEIDGALVRVQPNDSNWTIGYTVRKAAEDWRLDERMEWAHRARQFYDFRAMGRRLREQIDELATQLEQRRRGHVLQAV